MRSLLAAILGLCMGFLAPVPANAASLEEQVKAAYEAWDAAFNKGDAKAVSAFYTDDATFLPATHDIIKGPAGVEKFFASLIAAGATGHKLELIEAEGDAQTVVGAAKYAVKVKDGIISGIATHVFKKQPDGSLKLKLHTFN